MGGIRRFAVFSLLWCAAMLLFCGCADTGAQGVGTGGQSPQEDSKTGSRDKEYGMIGTMDGIQFDEKYGNLISPYTRCQISLEEGAETFTYLDKDGTPYSSSFEQLTASFDTESAEVVQKWDADTALTTQFHACTDGSMDIVQRMEAADGGVSGVRFRITVPMKYRVIIPAWDGICLDAEHPEIFDKRTVLTYPREWQAQMLLIQGTNGGMLIQARDDGTQFKDLNITNDGENFLLDIGTVPQAPFTEYRSFETVTWSMIPYEGTWMEGSLLYKKYVDETFRLTEINASQPEWAEEIQLFWVDDLDSREKLELLAKEVNPRQTLVYVPGWRAAAYDTEYPDYTPKEGLQEMIDFAHSLGFKVALHCNMIGCSFSSKEWENGLSKAASLDPYTQETIVEGYTAYGIDYRFGQMNQASVEWQDLMVERMTKLVEQTGVDCIHLDQSLLCFNDGRGYVNGMTSMQGNVELQRRLAEALPGVAFSGEGINEYNVRYADFLQQCVYGMDVNAQSWIEDSFEQICPITSVIFNDYARPYHYPALPVASEETEDYYLAWYRAGNVRAGHIPCLYRESLRSLTEPSDVFTMVLEDARFCMEQKPVINTGAWSEKAVMSYLLGDGTVAEWIRGEEDLSFYPDIAEDTATTQFVHHTDTYKTDRELRGWILYDEESLKGLRTDRTYFLKNTLRDNNATHITMLEENLTTRSCISNDHYTAIGLEEIIPSNSRQVAFTAYDGEMRAGEVVYEGEGNETEAFSSVQSFWYTLKNQGQVRHLGDRIMFHPPWRNESDDIGYTWLEVDVPLEVVGNASFQASFQLATAESAAGSDGVIFRVYAWEKEDKEKKDMISDEVFCQSEIALPLSLDLTRFEGKTVTVRIECYTGETPRNDSCLMVEPKILQKMGKVERTIHYQVHTHKPVDGILSLSGTAVYEALGDNEYTITTDIGDTVFLLHQPEALCGKVDMTQYPFMASWLLETGETSAPAGDLAPVQQVAEADYELRNGIFQHPPQGGTSELSFLVTLPDSPDMAFETAIAMKKGSVQSDGVTFRILVNGENVFQQEKAGASGFEEVSVDLSAYAGQTVILTLCTDSGETSAYDYAFWGDPLLTAK